METLIQADMIIQYGCDDYYSCGGDYSCGSDYGGVVDPDEEAPAKAHLRPVVTIDLNTLKNRDENGNWNISVN